MGAFVILLNVSASGTLLLASAHAALRQGGRRLGVQKGHSEISVAVRHMLHNMKFSPSAIKTDRDKLKLASVIKAYFAGGEKHVQFIVEDEETLKDDKVHPEKYGDLLVRVAGYSTYFVQLTPGLQNEVIARTENQKVGSSAKNMAGDIRLPDVFLRSELDNLLIDNISKYLYHYG